MNLNIELTPLEEARFRAFARQLGSDPATIVKKLLTESLPSIQVTEPAVDEENATSLALLESWIAAAPTDPDEIRSDQEARDEFVENLNRNRIESGERPIFP